jgi:hypothetical protein
LGLSSQHTGHKVKIQPVCDPGIRCSLIAHLPVHARNGLAWPGLAGLGPGMRAPLDWPLPLFRFHTSTQSVEVWCVTPTYVLLCGQCSSPYVTRRMGLVAGFGPLGDSSRDRQDERTVALGRNGELVGRYTKIKWHGIS